MTLSIILSKDANNSFWRGLYMKQSNKTWSADAFRAKTVSFVSRENKYYLEK